MVKSKSHLCRKNKETKNKPGIDRCKLPKGKEQNAMKKRQESLSSNRDNRPEILAVGLSPMDYNTLLSSKQYLLF